MDVVIGPFRAHRTVGPLRRPAAPSRVRSSRPASAAVVDRLDRSQVSSPPRRADAPAPAASGPAACVLPGIRQRSKQNGDPALPTTRAGSASCSQAAIVTHRSSSAMRRGDGSGGAAATHQADIQHGVLDERDRRTIASSIHSSALPNTSPPRRVEQHDVRHSVRTAARQRRLAYATSRTASVRTPPTSRVDRRRKQRVNAEPTILHDKPALRPRAHRSPRRRPRACRSAASHAGRRATLQRRPQ